MEDSEQRSVEKIVYNFFIESTDFNGISLRDISTKLDISYEHSIELIKKLVESGSILIQSSTNPHIIGFAHHSIESQLIVLQEAKKIKFNSDKIGDFEVIIEKTEFPICVYPSQNYLKKHRKLDEFGIAKYSKELALAEPQLSFRYFETDVLERYINDPRFDFNFHDFYGNISCQYDENGISIQREEDQIFLKSFGLGFDNNKNRTIAVILRDLGRLSEEHQVYWGNKEINKTECKVLEDYYDNIINGEWITAHSIFSAVIGEINAIYTYTYKIFGIPIFKNDFTENNWSKNFTFFFTPTRKNYYDFINLLDKYISENINKKFFVKTNINTDELKPLNDGTFERVKKGTLRLLEEWISITFNFEVENAAKIIIEPFRKVRKERQLPAHAIIENEYDNTLFEKQKDIIGNCYDSLYNIRKLLGKHPMVRSVEIPDWLDNGSIKVF